MSYPSLKKNLENLLKERNYKIGELEKKAAVRRGNIANILEGKSKKPSAELLQSIANVFGLTINDLFDNQSASLLSTLTPSDLELIIKINQAVSSQIIDFNFNLTFTELTNVVKEMYVYHKDTQKMEVDAGIIRWFLKNKHTI